MDKSNWDISFISFQLFLSTIDKVFIGHIGDSRVYRIRKEFMRKLTQDHSYVQKLVKDGTITQEQAIHHPQKNMLT